MTAHTPDGTGYLAELAGLGGYFALEVATMSGEWRSLPELFADSAIDEYVGRTRAAMAIAADAPVHEVPVRVAASSFQLAVAARLLSPVVGSALCFGAVPMLDHRSLRWQPSASHTPRFAVTGPDWVATPTESTAARVVASSVVEAMIGLGTRLEAVASLSAQVTAGNLASAANGAVTVLGLSRPGLLPGGRALVGALLGIEPLAGTGSFVGGLFRRRSCCLYYQAPRSGLCGDCVLTLRPTSQPPAAN